jgi:hypothetical protein
MTQSDTLQECIAEMRCFVRGGVPGVARLERVYKNIFLHYDIFLIEDKCSILNSLSGLNPVVRNRMLEEVGWVNNCKQPTKPPKKNKKTSSGKYDFAAESMM